MSKLTDKDRELLVIAMEECNEVAIECSKILRFGFSKEKEKNLNGEVGDLMCMLQLMQEQGFLDVDKVDVAAEDKRKRLRKWSSLFK